jgi:uncharacterized protein (DUF2062 family)
VFRRRHPVPLKERLSRWLWPHIGWRRAGSYLAKRTMRLSGTPHSIAAGVACGVAISFTPFMGFHLIGTFLLAWLVRGSYLAGAIGTLTGNPWTFPFIWVATYKLGVVLLGTRAVHIAQVQDWSSAGPLADVQAIFWPMVVGGIPFAVLAGLATYFPLVRVIAAYQEARARRRQSGRGRNAQGPAPEIGLS